MSRYAVDIVLLPPDEIIIKAIEFNRELVRHNPPKVELNKTNCIPHISLSMGVLQETDVNPFTRDLTSLAGKHDPLQLRCKGIYAVDIPTGEKVSGIAIENSDELYALHKDVMDLSGRYLTNDAEIAMVFSPPPVEKVTLDFINNYPRKSAYENFNPHITLGVGEMVDRGFTFEFSASTLALFHLGNYCTCRLMMAEIQL